VKLVDSPKVQAETRALTVEKAGEVSRVRNGEPQSGGTKGKTQISNGASTLGN